MKTGNRLPNRIADALRLVIDYLIDDEAADYLATSPREDREHHIYVSLRILDDWLKTAAHPVCRTSKTRRGL